MKITKLFLLISILFYGQKSISQTVHPDYRDGYISFKVKDGSEVGVTEYSGGSSSGHAFDSLITNYGIYSIQRVFPGATEANLLKCFHVWFHDSTRIDTLLSRFLALNYIEYAEKEKFGSFFTVPNDQKYYRQWAYKKIMGDSVWNLLPGDGKKIKIGVIDDAFLLSHEDLRLAIDTNYADTTMDNIDDDLNGVKDDYLGGDLADNDNDVSPPLYLGVVTSSYYTHGTRTASDAVASTYNTSGIASFNVSGNLKLIPVKISNDAALGIFNVAGAIYYACNRGAKVVNLSLNSMLFQDSMAMAAFPNVIFVVAVGNSGDSSYFPLASYNLPNIIAVGASNEYDEKAVFSTYSKHVDVMAPGTAIINAIATGNDHYDYTSGTSHSAPIVAGLCAALMSYDSTLTAAQVIARIKNTCDDISHINPEFRYQIGAGRINALRALDTTASPYFAGFRANSLRNICSGDTISFTAKSYSGVVYNWDFGDGLTTSGYSPTVLKTFVTEMGHDIRLTITDSISGDTLAREKYEAFVSVHSCTPHHGRNSNWIFGKYASLDFNVGGVLSTDSLFLANSLWSLGATVTESNPVTGALVYYAGYANTNNTATAATYLSVFNKDHTLASTIMTKSGWTVQGIVSIPLNNRYYLFANSDNDPNLHYYELTPGADTIAVNPVPRLVSPDTTNYSDTAGGTIRMGQSFIAIPGCTSNDYWIIGQASENAGGTARTRMLVVKVTNSSGVVSAKLHSIYSMPSGFEIRNEKYLITASPDGSMIARSNDGKPQDAPFSTDLFRFDRGTGTLSHQDRVHHGGRGVSFSQDGKLLYVLDLGTVMYQCDLEDLDADQSAMALSVEDGYGMIQMAPDNKIYIPIYNSGTMGIINHPEQRITIDNFNSAGLNLEGFRLADSTAGLVCLPNMIIAKQVTDYPLNFSLKAIGCRQYEFYPNKFCTASWSWKFGDGSTSSSKEPTHTYSQGGIYTVKLFYDGDSVERSLYVGAAIFGDSIVCDSSEIYTYYHPFNEEFDYKWSVTNGTLIGTDSTYKIQVKFNGSGTVKLVLNDPRSSCLDSFSLSVDYGINFDTSGFTNTITPTTIPDMRGCVVEIDGTEPTSGTPNYSWVFSTDSLVWDTLTNANYNYLAIYPDSTDSLWARRIVSANCYLAESNLQLVKPNIIITRQPQDYYTCNTRVYFSVIYENPSNVPLSFVWMYNDTNVGNPDVILSTKTSDLLNYYENTSNFGNYYTCQFSTDDCDLLTSWARYDRSPDTLVFYDSIWLSDTLINEWDTALAIVWDSTVVVDSGAYVRQYIWQKSKDGVNFSDIVWDSAALAQNNNDSFKIIDQRACEWYAYYRVKIRAAEDCPYIYSNSTPGIRTTTNAQLMMRDYYDDGGTEPNDTTDWRNLYDPPSLLIRIDDDGGTEHLSPNWGTDTAYVYYTIHNVGTLDSSKPAKLKMYWTSGGPNGADWSLAWQDVVGNRFRNLDTNSAVYDSIYPYGDFINEIPIEVPSIAPGDSIRDYFMWTDFPNPLRYYVLQNDTPSYANTRIMCLLARVETCPQDSFGLARQETSATRQNIINNSRIVGRNTHITNLGWTEGKKEAPLTVRRFAGDDDPLRVTFEEVGTCGFGSYGRVKAVLSDALWEAWRDGGYVGSGYSIDSYGILSVTNLSDFEVGNIELDPDSVALLTFEFELTSNPFTTLNCRYAVAQYQGESSTTPYGTFVINVNAIGEPEGGLVVPVKEPVANEEQNSHLDLKGEALEVESLSPEQELEEENTLKEKSLFAYPNPFTNEVNFYFELSTSQKVGFEIYNSLGAVVGRIEAREFASGKHKSTFDGSELAPGMYLCKVRIGEETKTLRLIIAR